MTDRVVLVGELNPYGADPRFALYCEPPNSAGGRLRRRVLRMRERDYLRLPRFNLCEGRWSMPAARARATEVLESTEGPVVLLGRKVATAFGFGDLDFYESTTRRDLFAGDRALVLLPHPSGLNRMWNDPGAFDRARAAVLSVAPDLSVAA